MADPRVVSAFEMTEAGPRPRSANLSPLMRAKGRASQGEKVNFCPFGCTTEDIDEHGYCRHLVGFTTDRATYEPLVRKKGRRVVQVHRDRIETGEREEVEVRFTDPKTQEVRTRVEERPVCEYGPPQPEKVLGTDKLVQITCSYRVYRDVDAAAAKAKKAS